MEIPNTSQDRTVLWKDTVRMAWPAVCESFFISLAGMVDTYMVSGLGADAVAAVGLTTQPKFVFLSVFMAIKVAVSALIARRRGENNKREANEILLMTLLLSTVMVVLLTSVAVGFSDLIISFCGSTRETHEMAVLYFRVIMGGMIFNAFPIVINAAQRGAGNTKIAMRTNLVSNAVNVIGNYLLIQGNLGFPALGIRGAAIATVFGSAVGCAMSVISLMHENNFISLVYIVHAKVKIVAKSLISIVKVGYSVFFEQILMRIGFMSTALMAADMGTSSMAAHQVGMNIMSLTFSLGDGMQVAAVALIGRSLGAKDPDRAKAYGGICRKIGLGMSIVIAVIYFFFGESVFRLFFAEEEIVAVGVRIIRVAIFVVLFQISQVIYMGCLRGAGDTAYTAMASTVSVTVIRTVCGYVCCYTLGLGMTGIWLGILSDQFSRYLMGMLRFRQGKWVNIKI